MPAPFEIIAAPFVAYYAPLGTAFPAITAAPGNDWVLIGASGDESYDPEGVTVQHPQDINLVRPLGSTAPVKAFRREEDLIINFTVWDVSGENYRLALNQNTITTVAAAAGTAGTKAINLYRGEQVATMALLLRAEVSPYGDDMRMQYEVPYCAQTGDAEAAYRKGDPAGLTFEFTALKNPNAATKAEAFGRLVMQHQPAL